LGIEVDDQHTLADRCQRGFRFSAGDRRFWRRRSTPCPKWPAIGARNHGRSRLFFVSTVKNAFGYDDALDVFGVHCIGGIIGALGTGILVNPALGGVGITDYTNITGNNAGTYDLVTQMIAQSKAVLATLLWSGVGSAILYKVVDVIIGLRPPVEAEREGLDITDHGERAYNM
jgi:Amt family ammonium transporter